MERSKISQNRKKPVDELASSPRQPRPARETDSQSVRGEDTDSNNDKKDNGENDSVENKRKSCRDGHEALLAVSRVTYQVELHP
jgi:hypothetical protein